MATLGVTHDNQTSRFHRDLTPELLAQADRTLEDVVRGIRQLQLQLSKLEGMVQHGQTDHKTKR